MEKKRFLFVSIDALITDLAYRIKQEGHEVKFYIESKDDREVGDEFVEKVEDWERWTQWADVIVFDDTLGQGKKAQKLREMGLNVIGGTEYTDKLEDDRAFGQEELKKHGVNIIPYRNFDSFAYGIEHIRQHPGRYVVKPSGHIEGGKKMLFVGEDETGRDVIQVLEAYRRAFKRGNVKFQLQKRVQGVEVAVGAFFNGSEFVTPININFENKKLFPGNIGVSTGEMGTMMYWSEPNKIFNNTLKKLEGKLKEESYVGYIDLNCIVNGNGIYPLEFTSRFGYPTVFIQQEGIKTPIGEFMYELATGKLKSFKAESGFQVGVRVCVPPFPYNDPEVFNTLSKDNLIYFKKPNYSGVHFEDVKMVNGEWVVTGSSGVVLVVVGKGESVKQAQAQAYKRIENILIPNMYYRTDIGDRWFEEQDKLHTWGYLREN